jgi:thioredoxin 2
MSDALHIVCSGCQTVNRLPVERVRQAPKCGQCGQPLFTSRPIVLTSTGLRKHVRADQVPLVVDFWAPWCGPCKAMAPAFEQAARELEPDARCAKLDTEAEPGIGGELGIRGIPTLILFDRGRELARHVGAIGASDIVRWVRSNIEPRA